MIGRIAGVLLEKNPPQLLIDVNGVGYEIEVPMSTFYNLPVIGQSVSLHVHMVVREDAQLLFGFGSEDERRAFRQLIRISGVGARIALALLSGLSVAELVQAVALQESGRLVKVPGIGKKTAERLLLELKGKLGDELSGAVAGERTLPVRSDVINALLGRGWEPLRLFKWHMGLSIGSFALITAGGANASLVWILYFAIGTGGAVYMTMVTRMFPQHLNGRANTASNMLSFGATFALQWGIGAALDLFPSAGGGHAALGYQRVCEALLALLVALFVVLILPLRRLRPVTEAESAQR